MASKTRLIRQIGFMARRMSAAEAAGGPQLTQVPGNAAGWPAAQAVASTADIMH